VDKLTLNRTGYRDIMKISHDPATIDGMLFLKAHK
jgi:hypothetical protein